MRYSYKEYKDGTVAVYIDNKFMCEMKSMSYAKKVFKSDTIISRHSVNSLPQQKRNL